MLAIILRIQLFISPLAFIRNLSKEKNGLVSPITGIPLVYLILNVFFLIDICWTVSKAVRIYLKKDSPDTRLTNLLIRLIIPMLDLTAILIQIVVIFLRAEEDMWILQVILLLRIPYFF